MNQSFCVDFRDTPFPKTGYTGAFPNRSNWRCEILLTRNQEAIKGKRILDMASHDGRLSYACLKLGAKHVTGVEAIPELVEASTKNLLDLGCRPEQFTFITGDTFDYLAEIKPEEFDTVLCLGLFYHTVRQNDVLIQVKRIKARYFILDTRIARGAFLEYPYWYIAQLVKWGRILRIPRTALKNMEPANLRKLAQRFLRSLGLKQDEAKTSSFYVLEPTIAKAQDSEGEVSASESDNTVGVEMMGACLVFRRKQFARQEIINPTGLVAWPTKAFIELLFRSYGFTFKQLHWKGIGDWSNLKDYKAGWRVSYIAQPLE